jgi:prepilin-type N-terminal cleavage/methylation domain-containing protein
MQRRRYFSPRLRARQVSRGFTLVELMVALTAGLFISIVVFALSRDTTRFYQSETRVANATLAGTSGFTRLTSDLARAGHLISPNISADPRVCNRPQAGWPARLLNLRSVIIDAAPGGLVGTDPLIAGFDPMAVEIAGALDNTEEFPIRSIAPDGAGGWNVYLQTLAPAMTRIGFVQGGPDNLTALRNVFLAADGSGRAVRIVDKEGMEQYALVRGVTIVPELIVQIAGTPALLFRSAGGTMCGFKGFNTGATINTINFVRYTLRRLKGVAGNPYEQLFAAADENGPHAFEANRTELVRVELEPVAGTEIPGSLEIVSEYAMDLQLQPIAAQAPNNPALQFTAPGVVTATYGLTQLVRGLRVQLVVRSREPDRDADIPGGQLLYRASLTANGGGPFARLRTFQSHIPLRNQQGANWQ